MSAATEAAREFDKYKKQWSHLRVNYYNLQKNLYFGWENYQRIFSSKLPPMPPNINLDWDNIHEHIPDWLFMAFIPAILNTPRIDKWLCPFNDKKHIECQPMHKDFHLNGIVPEKFSPYILCHAECLWLLTNLADGSLSCSRISYNSRFYRLLCNNFILSRVTIDQDAHVKLFRNIGCRHCITIGNFIVLKIVDFIVQTGFPMLYHLATGYTMNRNTFRYRCPTCILKKRCKFNLFNMATHYDEFLKCRMCGDTPCKHRRLINEIICDCEDLKCPRRNSPPSLQNLIRQQHRTLISNNHSILPKILLE